MRLSRISDLQAFVAVVEKASLTSAAHQLGRSLQSVSRSLAAIEQDVGVELIRRTTRRSNPTEAGLAYYQRLKTALEDIEEAKLQVSHRRLEPSGLLRISGPTGFAALHLVPATAAFLKLHPKIEVEISTYDRYVDLVEDNLDLAVHIGPLPDSVAKAKRLADLRRVFFAAPDYFAKYGRPKHPQDLAKHQCIVRTARVGADIWPFTVDGKVRTI
jgi:DNA-binding transcriptional LysR family regulator